MNDGDGRRGERSSHAEKSLPTGGTPNITQPYVDLNDAEQIHGWIDRGQASKQATEGEAKTSSGRAIMWPFVGQALAALLAAVASLLAFWLLPSGEAAAYFAAAAFASFLSTIGALGQRKGLTRDLSLALTTGFDLRSLVFSRLRLVGWASLLLALVAAISARWVLPEAQRSFLMVAAVVAWVGADSFRGTLADAQISLGNDRRAMLLGDGSRWVLIAMVMVGYLAAGGRRADVLIAVAAGGSVLFSIAAGLLLERDVRVAQKPQVERRLAVDTKSVAVLTATDVSGALTSQLTIVFVAMAYPPNDVSAFSLAMRIAAGLSIVQAGTLKFVLPNSVGVNRMRTSGAARSVQVATGVGTAVAIIGALAAVAIFGLLRDDRQLAVLIAILATGVIGNIASGPNEPVLVANGWENAALASNFTFGVVAAVMPLLYFAGLPIAVVACGVAVAILGHNGIMAGIGRSRLGTGLGFWWLPTSWLSRR